LQKRTFSRREPQTQINESIRASEVRVIDEEGELVGVLSLQDALKEAVARETDLVEISPNAQPPVAKLIEYGKYQYQEQKKKKEARANSHATETKVIQVKINTGEHDLELKAKKASAWLKVGHRVKIELYLKGRSKYMDKKFHEERLGRILQLITESYKIDEPMKKNPKGLALVISKSSK
jgi:translation initiation factor IF-3